MGQCRYRKHDCFHHIFENSWPIPRDDNYGGDWQILTHNEFPTQHSRVNFRSSDNITLSLVAKRKCQITTPRSYNGHSIAGFPQHSILHSTFNSFPTIWCLTARYLGWPVLTHSTRQVMYACCNTEVHLCNHCCSGKGICITYSLSLSPVCVRVRVRTRACVCVCGLSDPARNVHVLYYIATCGLSGSTIFFHIISQRAQFLEKKLLNIKCVFWFSLQLLTETLLILRTEQDIIKKVLRSSCKLHVILVRF